MQLGPVLKTATESPVDAVMDGRQSATWVGTSLIMRHEGGLNATISSRGLDSSGYSLALVGLDHMHW